MEAVLLSTGILLNYLESATEFAEDEADNLENFFTSKLRPAIFGSPQREADIQNAIETLLVGRGMTKGIEYNNLANMQMKKSSIILLKLVICLSLYYLFTTNFYWIVEIHSEACI